MAEKNMHDGHRKRMRERFEKSGFSDFADHEILEYMLYFVFKRSNTNELAHKLIDKCGSLVNVFSAKQSVLSGIDGVGDKTVEFITVIDEFMKEYKKRMSKLTVFDLQNIESRDFIINLFANKNYENLYLIALDSANKFLGYDLLYEGTFSEVGSNVGQMTKRIWEMNAAKVILAHNHPSGVLRPSDADIQTTHLVRSMLDMIGVKLVEHMIVAHEECMGIFEYLERDEKKSIKYNKK